MQRFVLIFCLIFYTALVFYQLGNAPLENWDEAFYGEAVKQILLRGDPIVLYVNGNPFLEKPPFQMWLVALVSLVIGLSEFSIRSISAFSSVLIVGIVTVYSYRRWGFIPSLFAFATLILNNVFLWRARTGNLDLLPTLFFVLTFVLTISNYKYRYRWLGLVLSLLYLTKLGLTVFPFAVFTLHEIIFKYKDWRTNLREYGIMFAAMLVLPGIWLAIGTVRVGMPFLDNYVFNADQNVLNWGLRYFSMDYIMFAYYSLQRRFFFLGLLGLLAMSFFLVVRLLLSFNVKKITNSKPARFITTHCQTLFGSNREYLLIVMFSIIILIQLTFVERKNNWYLVPSMPFWSLAIAYGMYVLIEGIKKLNTKLCAAFILLSFGVSMYLWYRTFTINIIPLLDQELALAEAHSARIVREMSEQGDSVARLDHLYPTTIFYTDRKVYSAPENATGDDVELFISRKNLVRYLEEGKIRWVVGRGPDAKVFIERDLPEKYRDVKTTTGIWGELVIDFESVRE